jgi:hypothetical protein
VSTETVTAGGSAPAGTDWLRAEFVLTGVAFLCFALIPIQLTTIYSGLPAHPLFVHIPVMLIPIAVIGAVAFVIKPQWWTRYGIALSVIAIAAMAGVFITMGAGSALRNALNLHDNTLVQRHSSAADKLRILDILFTAVVVVTFAAHRISGGMPTGQALVDRVLSPRRVVLALRVVLVLLALGTVYMCFKTGDLGAKAVWQNRLHGGFPGGGGFGAPPGGGFGPPASGG